MIGSKLQLKSTPFGITLQVENTTLTRPIAIAWHLAPQNLKGNNPLKQAEIQQWIYFAQNEIAPIVGVCSAKAEKSKQERATEILHHLLGALNSTLFTRTYFVGESVSLADIFIYCALLPAYRSLLPPNSRATHRNLTRWFETLRNQPAINKVVGPFELCTGECKKGR